MVCCAHDWSSRRERFFTWLDQLPPGLAVLNPVETLRWVAHKGYLRELADAGIPVVPTVWVDAGTPADLAAICRERGWSDAIIKPAVGSGSLGVCRVSSAATADQAQGVITRALRHGRDMLVQPYLSSVESEGELSVVFVDRAVSHALRKVPQPGNFTAQHWHSTITTTTLIADEAALVERVVAAAGNGVLYGRIDLLRDDSGALLLSEIELIAPLLYLDDSAAGRLADAVASALAARA